MTTWNDDWLQLEGQDLTVLLARDSVAEIKTAEVTCAAMPVQIEGELTDGRRYYFRYRHGCAGVGFGLTTDDAVRDQRGEVCYGGNYAGDLSTHEVPLVFGLAFLARVRQEGFE